MDYKSEYERWCVLATDESIKEELEKMDEEDIQDAFYRDLAFGTGGLRGVLGAGTNRMNRYVVARATQGLADYLGNGSSVVIGYDSRIMSEAFAKVASSVFAANGIKVWLWKELTPVPTVSFAVRFLKASAGVMITASHNPSDYNGYKVYDADGCQITTEAAKSIYECIAPVDIFSDIKTIDFNEAFIFDKIEYIADEIMDAYLNEIKHQSVLFGDRIDRDVSIVYSPLNGSGLNPVVRALKESGFTNITIVEEQKDPDGRFPTCPYPNPEEKEAMKLGLEYCKKIGAELLIATDPDCDRCGIAVQAGNDYRLLSANETGLLVLDYVCSQRKKHNNMPQDPVFIKTIVTTDLAERIASHYGVKTINVLTGFKFIGEQISCLSNENSFICGFEESYGYLTGSYVRDKDGVNAAFIICEMFAYYKTRGVSLIEKLNEIYTKYGYCLNTLHSYKFSGSCGMEKMNAIMNRFRNEIKVVAGRNIISCEDFLEGLYGLPKSDVLRFRFDGGTVVIRPSGTEPKLKVYICVIMGTVDETAAMLVESGIVTDLNNRIIY